MKQELLTFPEPELRKEKDGSITKVWHCKECNKELGEFSAFRTWKIHDIILCGECAQKASPVYQEWLKEQEVIKCL